jgi:hypothetical protein
MQRFPLQKTLPFQEELEERIIVGLQLMNGLETQELRKTIPE